MRINVTLLYQGVAEFSYLRRWRKHNGRLIYNFSRDALNDRAVHVFRADIVSLPPPSDIPDGVVKGRGALLARKSHFTAAIRNVLTFLELYKSLVIMSQIWPYLGPCHATAARLASFAGFLAELLLWNLVDSTFRRGFLSAVAGKTFKIRMSLSRNSTSLSLSLALFLFIHSLYLQ